MSQYTEGNVKTFTAAEALAAFRRVMLDSSGNIVYSDAGQDWIGTTEAAIANAANGAVRLRTASGTRKMTAAGGFSIGDVLYGAADGKVDDSPTGQPIGRALEAATADGDIVEVLTSCDLSQGTGESVEVIGGAGGITALDLVYVSDQTDAVMTVLKAQATSGGRFADYICPNAIAESAKGVALTRFLLQGIDTSAGSVGDPVYLSDASAGGYTLVKPTATDKVQVVGRIVEDHAETGAILFDLSGPQQVIHDHSSNAEGGDLGDHNSGTITLADGKNIAADTTTGSKIGTATDQKIGFFNATPVVQQSHVADPAATASDVDDQSGGTPNGSHQLVDVATDTWDNEKADVENNFSTLATEYNKLKDDVEAINTAVDSILAQLASLGLQASS